MKTKTIRLSDSYTMIDGVLHVLAPNPEYTARERECYDYSAAWRWEIDQYIWVQSTLVIGCSRVLVGTTTGQDDETFALHNSPAGIPGNSDRSITRMHGWRGTTDNRSVYAYGEREVTKIRELKNGAVAVTVGPDLDPTTD